MEAIIHEVRSPYHRSGKGRGICTMNDSSMKENEIHRVRYAETRFLEQHMKREGTFLRRFNNKIIQYIKISGKL
uniref:Uncharacterized protein n=1 Tax=Lepeophtheirus salmonis TaxID=72036 RepID=A0A0K2UHU4_LEPSM